MDRNYINNMVSIYYIYLYIDSTTSTPFYVGKGKDFRWRLCCHTRTVNNHLRNKIKKLGADNIKIEFLHKNLTEKDALQKEIYWIKYYGRRDLKQGTLCNLTDGGEKGPFGYNHTEKAKKKMSIAKKGKPSPRKGKQSPFKGIPRSPEVCAKISKSNKGRIFSKAHRKRISNSLKERHRLDESKVLFLYTKEKKSALAISKILKRDVRCILNLLKEYKIPIRRGVVKSNETIQEKREKRRKYAAVYRIKNRKKIRKYRKEYYHKNKSIK